MLWLKALHVVSMVAWFAGLFYLPRLYVYHADTHDQISIDRFIVMERRLFAIMSIGAGLTLLFGLSMVLALPAYLKLHWLHAKLGLVLLLLIYHGYCYKFMHQFAVGGNSHTGKWYRGFNEVPSLLLLGIVILAVVKPF